MSGDFGHDTRISAFVSKIPLQSTDPLYYVTTLELPGTFFDTVHVNSIFWIFLLRPKTESTIFQLRGDVHILFCVYSQLCAL